MQNFLWYSAVIYLSTHIVRGAEVNSICGDDDWIPYKDEKCVKLFKTFQTRQEAAEVCRLERALSDSFVPSLVSIRSFDEQAFLTEFVFNASDSNNIWIGAERLENSSTEFIWTDGSPVQRFTYWDIDRPTDDTRRSCVLLQSQWSSARVSDLRWNDVSCVTGNWFICEKLQAWPIERLQQNILSIRRDLQYEVDSLTKQNADMVTTIDDLRNNLTTQLTNLQENPVPIGFIYVQLSGQPVPQNLWTTVRWTEITSMYAGLFFRAAGGNAATFGSTQAENSPRLSSVNRSVSTAIQNQIWPVPGTWSSGVSTGSIFVGHTRLQFLLTSGEVRPRNQAVRIWRRIQ